jgi:putative MATE family efflux protein
MRDAADAVKERGLFSLSWPVMMTLAVGISGPLVDSWFLSRISDAAAAGVGATVPVFMLGQTVLNSLGQAGAGIAGQYLGARRRRLATATFALLLSVVTAGGFLLGMAMCLASPLLVSMLGLKGEIAEHSTLFLRIIGAGFSGRALQSALSNLLAARGLTQWNLWSSVATVGGNTVLNALFVTGWFGLPQFGVQGVAMATTGTWAVVGIATLLLLGRHAGFRPSWSHLALGWRKVLRPLLRIGLPSMAEPVSYMLFQVVLASRIVRLGNLSLTARVYAANLANLPVIFSYGLGFGAQILVSHLVGAGEFDRADRRLRTALAWGCGLAFLAALGNALLGRWTVGFFTRDLAVVALGSSLLWVDFLLQPAKAANIALTFSLRAAGDSRFPAVVGSGLMWSVGLAACLTMAFGLRWGVVGIWAGMATDEWSRAVVNWARWRGGRWKAKGVVHGKAPVPET